MNNETSMGMNRTGIGTSPLLSREMIEGAREGAVTGPDMVDPLGVVRESYSRDAMPVGTVPPPATIKGVASTAIDALKGEKPAVLIDKLSERLAFERAGTRLWQSVLSKFDVSGTWQGGPQRAEIEQIVADEAAHFELVHRAVTSLGADPTVMSPSADLAGVQSMGLVQVISDPRTNLAQALHAMLTAELVDNDAWVMLIDLASIDHPELATSFKTAREAETRHLTSVRQWLVAHCRLDARGQLDGHAAA